MSNPKSDIASLSYTPYSNSGEFCLIQGESGLYYAGVRIENISFPLTIPANQAAICSCLGNGDHPVAILDSSRSHKLSYFWIEKFGLNELENNPDNQNLFDPLIRTLDDVQLQLKELVEFTYTDESNFPVAALLKTSHGFIPGVNVEFEEWNLGLCAERVAISRALASGYSDFECMHIYAPNSDYISPCGACRQVLYELMPNQELQLHHDDHSLSRHTVSHLLPHGFTSSTLKK